MTIKPTVLLAAALLCILSPDSFAKPLKVFILAGQSNMQGHVNVSTFDSMADDPKTAPILKEMRTADGKPKICDRVWISSIGCAGDDTTEQKGNLTTGFGASTDSIGPEFTFGIYVEKALHEPILIIKTSWGGKSLHTDFRPPGAGPYGWSDFELSRNKERVDDIAKNKPEKTEATGVDYRLMVEHVNTHLFPPSASPLRRFDNAPAEGKVLAVLIQRTMKSIHFVPPVIVLIIATAWLANLRGSKSTVKQDNALLREKIANVRNASISQNEPASAKAMSEKKPSENEYKPSADWVSTSRDWKELVLFNNNESQYRFRYTAAWARLEKLASEMSGDELVRAYSEMAALPVHAPFRHDLEWVMLKELERKNPEFAFSQYIAKYQSEDSVPARIGAFDKWLARDPAAATTWYESQLSAGAFDKSLDGKSLAKLPFESAFIMSLLASDPTAAEQRMNNIPPDLRASLGPYMWDVPKENGAAFVDLLRKTMPMDEYMAILRANSLTGFAFRLDYDKFDPESARQSLEGLGITPEERSTLVMQQYEEFVTYRIMRDEGNTPSREKFDDYRKWVQAIDPAAADRATGVALQSYLEKSKTAGALDFIEKFAADYHASGGGDELLIPLLEGSANGSAFPKDRARGLAMRISDEKLRAELLQKLN